MRCYAALRSFYPSNRSEKRGGEAVKETLVLNAADDAGAPEDAQVRGGEGERLASLRLAAAGGL